VIDSLLNGLGFIRVSDSSVLSLSRLSTSIVSVVEEVTLVSLVYVVNNCSSVLGYGF
jgi:hypothetical protein